MGSDKGSLYNSCRTNTDAVLSFPLVGNLSEIALGKGEKGGCFEEGLRTSRNDSKRKECLLTNSRISK